MNARRSKEVEKVREEGRIAFEAGKHIQTNPYPTYSMDHYQWIRGYMNAQTCYLAEEVSNEL